MPTDDHSRTRFHVVHFDDLPGVPCPCGTARRAFADVADVPLTIHRTEIVGAAEPHYHRRLTETYYVLECDPDAALELDGRRIPVRPGSCVVIPPGVVHRAIGTMTILNIVYPKFDPTDEYPAEDGSPGT